jgi:hypothetical protein
MKKIWYLLENSKFEQKSMHPKYFATEQGLGYGDFLVRNKSFWKVIYKHTEFEEIEKFMLSIND